MNYKSDEEFAFAMWLEQLKAYGYVLSYTYEPSAIQLSEKVERMVKVKNKVLTQFVMHPHEYTYDFEVKWNVNALGVFVTVFGSDTKCATCLYCDNNLVSKIEIKPTFDYKNMTREVTINIKWVFEKYGYIINLVKIPDFFSKSFTPDEYYITKTGKAKKLKHKVVITLEEYLDKLNLSN